MDGYVGRTRRVRHYLLEPQGREPVRKYPAERVCAAEGCITRLSVYNPSIYCSAHASLDLPLVTASVSRTGTQVLHRNCAHCGRAFVTTNPKRKFCTSRCRVRAHYERVAGEAARAERAAQAC